MRPIFVLLVFLPLAAHAAAPEGGDRSLAPWFKAQRSVDGTYCCDEADGHVLPDDRVRDNPDGPGKQVMIEGEWRDVPKGAIVPGADNPTGGIVVWWLPGYPVVRCFKDGFRV